MICPVCFLPDGFHDRKTHDENVWVPRKLIIVKDP